MAVSVLRNSFTEQIRSRKKKIGENKEFMETVRICNQEATTLENLRSTEGQVVASIDWSGEVLMGNEDSLTSGDADADYSNRDKFEFESDPTLHAALDVRTREEYQIQTTKQGVLNQNPYGSLEERIITKLNGHIEATIISLAAIIQRTMKDKLKSMIKDEMYHLQKKK